MSAKKISKTKTSTSAKKRRTRFPRIEAARTDQPLTAAAAEPAAEAAPREDASEITAPEADPAGPTPETMGVEGPAGDAATTGEATAADASPTRAKPPEPITNDRVAAVQARTTETLLEASGESPLPQATTELPTAATTATEAMREGMTPAVAPAESAATAPEALGTKNKPKPRAPKTKRGDSDSPARKLSALDAAARILGEASQPMGCKEMIAAMATKGYWTSPGGQTPDATLCSALLREITTKGEQSRFVKAAPGKFALRPRT